MQYYLTEPGRENRVVSDNDIRTAAFITTGKRLSDEEMKDYIDQLRGIERELTEEEINDPFTLVGYGATSLAVKSLYNKKHGDGMSLPQAYNQIKLIKAAMDGGLTN